jgi:DNA-directed RNA polymerase specialized sigma24 family protein
MNESWETPFLQNYAWLQQWARQLTAGKKADAEDLVHELYLRLRRTSSMPEPLDEDQVRAYLHRALKNLSINRKRKSNYDLVAGTAVVEFTSVEYLLSKRDRLDSLAAWSDLVGLCEYVCARRKTSRVAAVYILRFFLGYLPAEVMEILCLSRTAYDTHIEAGRLEARAYLERPHVLWFAKAGKRRHPMESSLSVDPAEQMLRLRNHLFARAEGSCIPALDLTSRYGNLQKAGFTTAEIAHLVSCRRCLHEVLKLLGLGD